MSVLGKTLRKIARPARDWVRTRLFPRAIQRVPLLPEDLDEPFRNQPHSVRRRRRHVLVDLIHEHCARSDVVVVEVGTRGGRTTAHVLKYCPQIRTLHAIDLVRPSDDNPFHGLERLEFIQSDSVAAAGRFADGSVDLVFIDADHSEAAVRRDIAAWRGKVKPGGVIAGHDYGSGNHPGVAVAVDEAFRDHHHPVRLDADKVWWTLA